MNLLKRLDACCQRGLLRDVPASEEKARLSPAQAREWITEAGYDCDADPLRSSLIAVCMGYFHAARALSYRDGIWEMCHCCIGVYLESYREKGLLETEWVLQLDIVRGLWQNGQ